MQRSGWMLVLACVVGFVLPASSQNAVMDFEGLPAGMIVDELSSGLGVTGPLTGVIKVVGESFLGSNTAVIFDSSDPTGEDEDLGTPNENFGGPGISTEGILTNDTALGNILILVEDLVDNNNDGLVDDPDDTFAAGSYVEFDFSMTGSADTIGTATIYELTFIDIGDSEDPPYIELFGPELPLVTIPIPAAGDNGAVTVEINEMGVSLLRVVFNGSGAVGEAVFRQDEAPCEMRTETQCEWGEKCQIHSTCKRYTYSKYNCYSRYSYSRYAKCYYHYNCYRGCDEPEPETDSDKAACILHDNFEDCFPEGLIVGCADGNTLTLSTAAEVTKFLPQGGAPAVLVMDYVDPGSSDYGHKRCNDTCEHQRYYGNCRWNDNEDWVVHDYREKTGCHYHRSYNRRCRYCKYRQYNTYRPEPGHFAGEVVTLTLNVTFDLCIEDFSDCPMNLVDLKVIDVESPCFGMTVGEVLDAANKALGGCDTALDAKELYHCVKKINANFEGGDIDMGFLGFDPLPYLELPILVNAGDDGFVDYLGRTWLSDTNFNTGETFTTDNPIAGSPDGEPYHSERWDGETGPELMYSFRLPAGDYIVRLHFAEFYTETTQVGDRVFDVAIEGQIVLDDFDMIADSGFETAIIKEFVVPVTDGTLNIEFLHGVENPKISGIEVYEAP